MEAPLPVYALAPTGCHHHCVAVSKRAAQGQVRQPIPHTMGEVQTDQLGRGVGRSQETQRQDREAAQPWMVLPK